MISDFPNELISEILSYINKIQDQQSCLFVCSQWMNQVSSLTQKNLHNHTILKWWNIHKQILKFRPEHLKETSLARDFCDTSKQFYARGYKLYIINKHSRLIIQCRTIFHHFVQLFTIPIQPIRYKIKTAHLNCDDVCCVHLDIIGTDKSVQVLIKIHQNEPPSYRTFEFVHSECPSICNIFDKQQGYSISYLCNHFGSHRFVFFLRNMINVYHTRWIKITVLDLCGNQTFEFDLGTDECFLTLSFFSKNYLFFPMEKSVICWNESEQTFQHFKILKQPKSALNLIHFLCTKKHGLLFWFEAICYVGKISKNTISLSRFHQFHLKIGHQNQPKVSQCEQNDQLFTISSENNPFVMLE